MKKCTYIMPQGNKGGAGNKLLGSITFLKNFIVLWRSITLFQKRYCVMGSSYSYVLWIVFRELYSVIGHRHQTTNVMRYWRQDTVENVVVPSFSSKRYEPPKKSVMASFRVGLF